MRVGYHPHKDQLQDKSRFVHQVVIPVYIPHNGDYFKDALKILELSLRSVFATVHEQTFLTVVDNGSCSEVAAYLDKLLKEGHIHELVHTENIGKLNAIIKGLVGHNTPLVTIADSDILFLSGWQQETTRIFNAIAEVGVVGLIPQFKMFERHCGNLIWSHLFKKSLRFTPVKDKAALAGFYDSIGWKRNYNPDYLEYNLSLSCSGVSALAGSGHAVATYKRDVFSEIISHFGYKLGGDSELYLDTLPLEKDYWRVTTNANFACHMGNVYESWMSHRGQPGTMPSVALSAFASRSKTSKWNWFFKNKIIVKIISVRFLFRLFLRLKKLPPQMIHRY